MAATIPVQIYVVDANGDLVPVGTLNPLPTGSSGGGGGATTVADGADVAQGAIADAAVSTDTTGSVSGKLRGLVKLVVNLLSRWPASLQTNGGLKVEGVAGGVAQSVAESIKTLTQISGTAASSGDNSVVAAPSAGNHLVVSAFVVQNEAATANTMILRPGTSSTTAWRCLGQNQGDGLSMVFPPGRCWRLPTATALNLNLSAATSCGYSVSYWSEAD